MRPLCLRSALVLATLTGMSDLPVRAAVYNVGAGGPAAGCEAPFVTDAIALAAGTAAADEIRLTSNYLLFESLVFTDWNINTKGPLTISGGWTDCNDTTPNDDLYSELLFNVDPNGVLVNATVGSPGSFLTLRRVRVAESSARGIRVENNGTLALQNSRVQHNDGGGIRVQSGGYLFVDGETVVSANGGSTVDGGGIRCTGAGSEIVIDGFVVSNDADEGGGILAESQCEVTLGIDSYVQSNEATFGGGLLVRSGAVVSAGSGTSIDGNLAASSGGGLYAEGTNTTVQLLGTSVSANDAGFAGGGIYVTASAEVILDGGGSCESGAVCPSGIWSNELLSGQDGAAAFVANGAKLRLYQTSVNYNVVHEEEPDGSILHAAGTGAELFAESVVVWNNTGAGSVFEADSGGAVRIAFTTAALNRYDDGGLVHSLGVEVVGPGSLGRINSSIFYPTGGYFAAGGGTFSQVDCLITSTTTGLPPEVSEVHVGDPGFLNLFGRDLRVAGGSIAVDFCDDFYYSPTQGDYHGAAREFDLLQNPNGSPGPGGAYDLGAFEFAPLFSDGFESGNTSAWDFDTP